MLVPRRAQVVCGTSMGMMEHPDLREARNKRKSTPVFDMMILDEASKTSSRIPRSSGLRQAADHCR